ncbi:unnamed protein product [Arctogadus glacialis]
MTAGGGGWTSSCDVFESASQQHDTVSCCCADGRDDTIDLRRRPLSSLRITESNEGPKCCCCVALIQRWGMGLENQAVAGSKAIEAGRAVLSPKVGLERL